jgi:taurine transport system ATP-binding protein
MSSPSETVAGAQAPAPSAAHTDGGIHISGVQHRYGTTTALGPIDLAVEPGSFLVLVGASGCGKSTLLRLIAGFESPTEGELTVSGRQPVPGKTAGVVFQQPRLFPWRSVGGNIELALKYSGTPRERRAQRRDELLHRVGLEAIGDRKIWEISGGQQQRVAIARALASERPETSLLLLDEPFAALDAPLRARMREELKRVRARFAVPIVLITHDPDDVAALDGEVIHLAQGRVAAP